VEGADVVVLDRVGSVVCRGITDAEGRFVIGCPARAAQRLRISRLGYQGRIVPLRRQEERRAGLSIALAPGAERLDPLVVTADRAERALGSAASAVSVVSGAELRAKGSTELAAGLENVPGLSFTRASGSSFNMSARGFNSSASRRLLLLVDGRRASTSNVLGFVGWDGLPFSLREVERVEVLKGPGSTLYGANAHSGLVQIVTRDPRELQGTVVDLSAGERSTVSTDIVHGATAGPAAYSVSAGYLRADEWPLGADTRFLAGGNVIPYTESVRPSSTRRRLRANVVVATPLGSGRLRVSSGFSARDGVWVTGAGRVQQDGDRYTYAAARFTGPRWTVLADANWNDSGTWVLLRNGQKFYEISRDAGAHVHRRIALGGRGHLILGGEYRYVRADTRGVTFPGVRTQNLYGAFGQAEVALAPGLDATLGARVDHHPQSGWHFSPKVGLVAEPAPNQSLYASYSEGYQNPSLVELFIHLAIPQPQGPTILIRGNEELKPERLRAYEVGYRGSLRGVARLSVDAFRQELDRFVSDLVPVAPDPPTLSYRQSGESTARGVDVTVTGFVGPRLRADAGYAYVRITGTGEPPNVPGHRASAGLRYDGVQGWFVRGEVSYVAGFSWQAGQLLADIPAYTLVGAALGYAPPGRRWSLSLRGRNLLDRDHIEMAGGSLLGRRLSVGASVRF